MRLPLKDSATWRSAITASQTLVGFLAALTASPELTKLVTQFYPWALPAVSLASGLASLIVNLTRKDVKNY